MMSLEVTESSILQLHQQAQDSEQLITALVCMCLIVLLVSGFNVQLLQVLEPGLKYTDNEVPISDQLAKRSFPKELYDTIFAEASGGKPDEIAAVASAFLNRADALGMDEALLGSSAYRKKSKQFLKAQLGELNEYEQKFYDSMKTIVDSSASNRAPYWFFENVSAFGNPPWLSETSGAGKRIGRQTFYERKQ